MTAPQKTLPKRQGWFLAGEIPQHTVLLKLLKHEIHEEKSRKMLFSVFFEKWPPIRNLFFFTNENDCTF